MTPSGAWLRNEHHNAAYPVWAITALTVQKGDDQYWPWRLIAHQGDHWMVVETYREELKAQDALQYILNNI